jgi:hypothetical protein
MSKSNETPQSSNAKNEQKYHSQDYYQAVKQAFKETTYVVAHESRFDIKKKKKPSLHRAFQPPASSCNFRHAAFPANILRRQPYEALLIRAPPAALRASPQAKSPFLQIDFSEIHGCPIVRTSDSGNHVHLIHVSVLGQDEVSARGIVVDETIRLRTGIRERLFSFTRPVQEALIRPHLHMMLVTKRAKFLARLGSRHRPSSRTPPNELPSETVYQCYTLVPLDFGVVPEYVLSYASGVQVSRGYSLKVQKLGGLEVAECEHLCILLDGKDQVCKERFVGLRDKSPAAFDGLLPQSAYATWSEVPQRYRRAYLP